MWSVPEAPGRQRLHQLRYPWDWTAQPGAGRAWGRALWKGRAGFAARNAGCPAGEAGRRSPTRTKEAGGSWAGAAGRGGTRRRPQTPGAGPEGAAPGAPARPETRRRERGARSARSRRGGAQVSAAGTGGAGALPAGAGLRLPEPQCALHRSDELDGAGRALQRPGSGAQEPRPPAPRFSGILGHEHPLPGTPPPRGRRGSGISCPRC